MIFAYPRRSTVSPGDDLVLHVSTDAEQFRVEIHRFGATPRAMRSSDWLDGEYAPQHLAHHDWGEPNRGLDGDELAPWPPYSIPIGEDWPSGVYVATLFERDDRGARSGASTPDARWGKALFVVRGAATRAMPSILYKLPLFTYHAYNLAAGPAYDPSTRRGSWCLYNVPGPTDVPSEVPPAVSLRRPGGGTGGSPYDAPNVDPFDPTPRQTFVHWDAHAIRWLEQEGYAVDYCTDLDLHLDHDLALLARYRLLVSVGHDEYWSDAMRSNAERFVHGGGNVAFLSANTCWWRIVFDDAHSFRRVQHWFDRPVPNDPENRLTGVSFRNGGERDRNEFPIPVGYRVQHADHWAFADTGLREGDVFGGRPDEYVVGYECDGAHFDRADLARGVPVRPTGEDGTPSSFVILGVGDLAASGWGFGNRAATMGAYENGGTVFTAATTDWARLLRDRAGPVAQITRNVLERLS